MMPNQWNSRASDERQAGKVRSRLYAACGPKLAIEATTAASSASRSALSDGSACDRTHPFPNPTISPRNTLPHGGYHPYLALESLRHAPEDRLQITALASPGCAGVIASSPDEDRGHF